MTEHSRIRCHSSLPIFETALIFLVLSYMSPLYIQLWLLEDPVLNWSHLPELEKNWLSHQLQKTWTLYNLEWFHPILASHYRNQLQLVLHRSLLPLNLRGHLAILHFHDLSLLLHFLHEYKHPLYLHPHL